MSNCPSLAKIINDALFETKLIHNKYFGKKEARLEGKFGGDSKGDAVTKADKETEEKLREHYAKFLPEYNFLGEETGETARYNGNGWFTINDPLDGTWNYQRGIKNFGAITSICKDGLVIAAGYSNTPKEQTFIAVREDRILMINAGRERYHRIEPKIYLGMGPTADPDQLKELTALVKEQFPGVQLEETGAAINAACVFAGRWPVFFHTGLAQHDISPISVFSALTGISATDHHGNPYTAIDPVAEIKKYQAGRQEVLYHNPILIAAPRDHEKMLRILERFNSFLDAKQLVGFRHARETN